jgi:2-succinyl-5-enolpyruvyl-6-hydroxy-3-cyclohexene-1-carboxylate synthase
VLDDSRSSPRCGHAPDVRIAADEAIRRDHADPALVRDAVDIAVIKVQPSGGVHAALALIASLGLPAVVSSALDTSVGLAAGVRLAAALDTLEYACGLATGLLLATTSWPHPCGPSTGCSTSRPPQRPPGSCAPPYRPPRPPGREADGTDRATPRQRERTQERTHERASGRVETHPTAPECVDRAGPCARRRARPLRCHRRGAVPGSRSAPFAFALDEEPRIRLHVHPDERSAAFVALGIAHVTGRPAAVVVTSGSAVANLHPAVVEADAAGVPLLLLTADRPPELRETGADQTIRQAGIFGTSRALGRRPRGRRGPARCGRDVAGERGPCGRRGDGDRRLRAEAARRAPCSSTCRSANRPCRSPTTGARWRRRSPRRSTWRAVASDARPSRHRAPRRLGDEEIATLATRFAAVERGLIVVGSGAQDHAIADAVHALSRATGWPVLAEGHTAARHRDGALRCWPHLVEHDRFRDTHRPELVVRVGRATLTRALARLVATATTELLVDGTGRWWDPARTLAMTAGELLVADPVDTFMRIADVLAMGTSSVWGDGWRDADARVSTALDAHLDGGGGHDAARVVRAVVADAPLGAHVVVASSMAIRHLDRHTPQRDDLVWHANRGTAGIDGNVSTALGVAIGCAATTGAPVIAIVGDIALLHDTNAWLLEAAVERLDVTVVVLDDDGGTIFDLLPPGAFPAQRHLFATPHGRDLAHLAALHGLGYQRMDAGALGLAAAVGGDRTATPCRLVHVPVAPLTSESSTSTRVVVHEALTVEDAV